MYMCIYIYICVCGVWECVCVYIIPTLIYVSITLSTFKI